MSYNPQNRNGQTNSDNSQPVVIASDQSSVPVTVTSGKIDVNAIVDKSGLATSTIQSNGSQKSQIVDAGGEVATVTGGKLDVNASVDTTGLALDATLTGGTQKSQLVDAGGEAATVTGGKLDVNASVDTTGLATSAKQDTGNTSLSSIDGKITAVNTGAIAGTVTANLGAVDNAVLDDIAANQTDNSQKSQIVDPGGEAATVTGGKLDVNASIDTTGLATSAKQLADNHQVTVSNIASTPVITGFATSAKQLADGHNVVVTSAPTTAVTNAGLTSLNSSITSNKVQVDVVTMPSVGTVDLSGDTSDLDSGAGTDNHDVVAIGVPASGGHAIIPGDATDGLTVNLGTNNDITVTSGTITTITNPVAVTGTFYQATQPVSIATMPSTPVTGTFWQATQPVSGTVTANISGSISNTSFASTIADGADVTFGTKTDAKNSATDGTSITAMQVLKQISASVQSPPSQAVTFTGSTDVATQTTLSAINAKLVAGTVIGDVDITPKTTGGWSVKNCTTGDTYTALTNTAQEIKSTAGKFGGYYIYNPNPVATYVMVYNIAYGSVTVGTSTAILVFCIPPTSGANLELLAGIPFSNAGWSIAAATTGGGNTAPATALEAMIFFK